MSAVLTNAALLAMLGALTEGPLELRLYANDHTPAPDDQPADYRGIQGAVATLEPEGWQLIGEGEAIGQPEQTIEGAFGTVYGWYVLHPAGFVLVGRRFEDAPHILRSPRDAEIIALSLAARVGSPA